MKGERTETQRGKEGKNNILSQQQRKNLEMFVGGKCHIAGERVPVQINFMLINGGEGGIIVNGAERGSGTLRRAEEEGITWKKKKGKFLGNVGDELRKSIPHRREGKREVTGAQKKVW